MTQKFHRRHFLALSASLAAGTRLGGAPPEKKQIGLVRSTLGALARPASPEHPLDYEGVRDMVWKAIEYAGGMERRVRPGSWMVLKPNLGWLHPQHDWCPGDTTDLRVLRAVLEYAAANTKAGRITIAEGGSYRGLRDPMPDNVVSQNGVRVDGSTYSWPAEDFPGVGGTIAARLAEIGRKTPDKRFDFVDLNYDGVRDPSGQLTRVPVPVASNGVGAFSLRGEYFVTNTIPKCDFLVSIPVVKCHMQCGVTASLKNYVGTAPRQAYARPGVYWNSELHAQHSVEDRIDPFIADLSAFHPPDFVVADFIRGLQYREHKIAAPDQMIRNNAVIASADPVAADALAAWLLGFSPADVEYLQMVQARGTGILDLSQCDVRGDDPAKLRQRWIKPADWHGRGNRTWRVTADPAAPPAKWARYLAPTDTLTFEKATGTPGAPAYGASVRVVADGHRKAFLWVGVKGRVAARVNGEQAMTEEGLTRYRIGQFRKAVELRPGENLLEFRVEPVSGAAQLSVLLVDPRNDGDTVDGIRWTA